MWGRKRDQGGREAQQALVTTTCLPDTSKTRAAVGYEEERCYPLRPPSRRLPEAASPPHGCTCAWQPRTASNVRSTTGP